MLDVIEDTSGALVTLLMHHCVADARAGLTLLAELWDQYTTVVTSGAAQLVEPRATPASQTAVLAEYGYVTGPVSVGDSMSPPTPTASPPTQPVQQRLRLNREETDTLTAVAKKHGVTLHGLISGAVMRGNSRAQGWNQTDGAVWFSYPINLRTRLTPQVPPTAVTNLLGNGTIRLDNAYDLDVVTFAKTVRDQLRHDLESGQAFSSWARSLELAATSLSVNDQILTLTNWGVVPELATPAGLVIDDFTSTWPDQAAPMLLPNGIHATHSFDGQLSVELVAPHYDSPVTSNQEQSAAVIAAIKHELLAVSSAM